MGLALGGVAGPRDQPVGVGRQVADGRVRLCEGNAQLCHVDSLVRPDFYRQSDEKWYEWLPMVPAATRGYAAVTPSGA
ncbi:hypothetical protein GCM10022224_074730 [Nonomuraea antimicrobica]|uniref:Uncharacterized protein n=1 Tax=Nonomuraea antimicrobica TaxID=561173 RepID=A0ABP7CZN8_9ACTN